VNPDRGFPRLKALYGEELLAKYKAALGRDTLLEGRGSNKRGFRSWFLHAFGIYYLTKHRFIPDSGWILG